MTVFYTFVRRVTRSVPGVWSNEMKSFDDILAAARACTLCAGSLEPNPVVRMSPRSRILVIGQAPGSKVHASGIPWDDASGDHLLEWLAVGRATFEDPELFGILPSALCYPGKGPSGDLPPPPICERTWHGPLLDAMERPPELTLLVGMYAVRNVLGKRMKRTLTETVRAFDAFGPSHFPLPHPSWRSKTWMKKNPWFATDVLPELRRRVAQASDR